MRAWIQVEHLIALLAGVFTFATIAAALYPCSPYPGRGIKETAAIYAFDAFDPTLARITDMPAALTSVAQLQQTTGRGFEFDRMVAIDEFVRRKFKHGYSQMTFCENWVANLAGAIWWDLRSSVDPDEIMRHSWAGCSQQSLIVQELARLSNLQYMSVRQPGHFSAAVMADDVWYLVDPDYEPDNNPPILLEDSFRISVLNHVYRNTHDPQLLERNLREGKVLLTGINNFPAKRGMFFQKFALYVSRYGFILLLSVFIISRAARYITRCKNSRLIRGRPSECEALTEHGGR